MQFLKLNILSMLYGLFLFVAVEFMLNIWGIENLTGEELTIVNTMTIITFFIIILGSGAVLLGLTKKWFHTKKVSNWLAILWIPYFALFIYGFTEAFPNIAGEMPINSFQTWILITIFCLYPFYILLINFLSKR